MADGLQPNLNQNWNPNLNSNSQPAANPQGVGANFNVNQNAPQQFIQPDDINPLMKNPNQPSSVQDSAAPALGSVNQDMNQNLSQIALEQAERQIRDTANSLGIPFVNLIGYPISNKTLALIPFETAKKFQAVPYLKASGKLRVAAIDPNNMELRKYCDQLAQSQSLKLSISMASQYSIDSALKLYSEPETPTVTLDHLSPGQSASSAPVAPSGQPADQQIPISQIKPISPIRPIQTAPPIPSPPVPTAITQSAETSLPSVLPVVPVPPVVPELSPLEPIVPSAPQLIQPTQPQVSTSPASVQPPIQSIEQKEIANLDELKKHISSVQTTQLFDALLDGAVITRSSDIHIEPNKDGMRIRYRIDGVLQDVVQLPAKNYKSISSRIKFLSKMKMDIHDEPQDGRFSYIAGEKNIDLRISCLPMIYGENFVMRLLENEAKFVTLDQLGFTPEVKNKVLKAIKKPTGLILNTGPTGSGKTTTLYAILDYLNKPSVKIITLEEPVEYRISGITQTQVNEEAEFTFAEGLKAILRQDPDIILVGEIRDKDTAKTALQASMTGHLVLSTLHTNNAPAALVRLIEMGIPPFLLPGAVTLIIAQRLVRKVCQQCKEEYAPDANMINLIKEIISKNPKTKNYQVPAKLWRGKGCVSCNNTGFSGRLPIAEVFTPSSSVEEMVLKKNPLSQIYQKVVLEGMVTMAQDGMIKVIQGLTTPEEVLRVASIE